MEDNKNIEIEKSAESFRKMVKDGKERIEAVEKELEKDHGELKTIVDTKREFSCSPTATTDTFLGGFCLGAFVTVCVAFATRAINRH